VPTKVPHSRLLKRLGTRLRAARTEKGLSQESLAFAAGLDRSYVSGIERGEFNVSILTLEKIAKALGTRLSAVLDGD
jgi:transcriptional regulator with XRE-family HTH domain